MSCYWSIHSYVQIDNIYFLLKLYCINSYSLILIFFLSIHIYPFLKIKRSFYDATSCTLACIFDINTIIIPMPYLIHIFSFVVSSSSFTYESYIESIIIIFDTPPRSIISLCTHNHAHTAHTNTYHRYEDNFRKLKKAPQRPDNMGVVLYWYHSALLFFIYIIHPYSRTCVCIWILSCNNNL